MTERATGRHRASQKSNTPLSTLTGSLSVVGDYVGSVRRSGVIIAMSSGLVASMALPAHAVNTSPEAVGPATASVPIAPGTTAGEALFAAPEGGLLALPPDLAVDEGAVAAPAAATVEFDHPSFTVISQDGRPLGATADDEADDDGPGLSDDADDADDTDDADDADDIAKPVTRRERRQAANAPSAQPRNAAAHTSSDTGTTKAVSSSRSGSKAVSIAFRYQGTPYLWGGTSPRGFDCSGFTKYVYSQMGKDLGRTVSAQRSDVKFVPRSQAKPGDLVFFGQGHVAIYLGNNQMIDAPRRAKTIQPRKIYSSNVQFGRVI